MSANNVIEIEGLCFAYAERPVLQDVSVQVPAGEMLSVVGPNGGGKTTLLKLILGELVPDRGSIRVFGQPPREVRQRLGYMPQYLHFDPAFPVSVGEVVLMGRVERHWVGGYSRSDRSAARQALAEVGLEGLFKRRFAALSGGQRQRVLIARALACDPELLIMDEPTANVDLLMEQQFHELLHRLNQRMTVVIVSHDLGFVSDIVSSVLCVNRRAVLHPTADISGALMQDIYGSSVRFVQHDHELQEQGND